MSNGVNAGASIEAYLKLNATGFHEGLENATTSVKNFHKSMMEIGNESQTAQSGLRLLSKEVDSLLKKLVYLQELTKGAKAFKEMGQGMEHMATAAQRLTTVSERGAKGIEYLNIILDAYSTGLSNAEIHVKSLKNTMTGMNTTQSKTAQVMSQYKIGATNVQQATTSMNTSLKEGRQNLAVYHQNLKSLATGIEQFNAIETNTASSIKKVTTATEQAIVAEERYRVIQTGTDVDMNRRAALLEKQSVAMRRNAEEKLRAMGYTGKLAMEEEKEAIATDKATASLNRYNSTANKSVGNVNRLTSSTSRLSKAMSSLRMIGSTVGSMLAYNFAHKLLIATGETIHAKSEMEGYFKMLNFGQKDVDSFNKALDRTVAQFQRVNKYSLGETISSIGVEFNLSTKEMEKAMKVTSMITSEYLRAGRNANEASLAVKDVLQGQFQRLSRETGVKGEQLKDAGWSGDTTDVLGLMEALEKVGKSRNWDIFAEKANSLNDILTITQNRFGEWSADLVNVVQPTIINFFNSLMSFSQGVAQGLTNLWEWLNTDGWDSLAVKIGAVTTALFTGIHALTAYRTGATLTQVSSMGLKKSLMGLVFGIKAEELAVRSSTQAIALKILGLNSEKIAEVGLTNALNEAVFAKGLEKITTEAQATVSELHADALVGEATAIALVKDEETGEILLKEGLTIATVESTGATVGFTDALGMMIAGEALAEGETLSLAGAIGALTGAFLTSPVGWFALAILGLASAFYVLSGGLDDSWDKMKKFNETMDNAQDEMKEAQDYLKRLSKEVGENSQKYKDAKKSVENWKHELESASYWMNHSKKAFEEMNLAMSTNTKPILRNYGLTEEEIDKFDSNIEHLQLGKNKYYKAEQVLNKQIRNEDSNFRRDLLEMIDTMNKYGATSDEMGEASQRLADNYSNLAEHSYIANTTDDWWEWMWNSLYAGLDQMWINLDKAKIQFGKWWDGMLKIFDEKGLVGVLEDLWNQLTQMDWGKLLGGMFPQLGELFDVGKWISSQINWDDVNLMDILSTAISLPAKGLFTLNDFLLQALFGKDYKGVKVTDVLEDYFGGVFDSIGKWFDDTFGGAIDWIVDGFNEHMGNVWNDIFEPLRKGLFEDLPNYVMESLGHWEEIFQPVFDFFSEIGEFLNSGTLMELLGLDPNTDYIGDFLNQYIVTPITDWFNGFLADPMSYINNFISFSPISILIDALFGSGEEVDIGGIVMDNLITPLGMAIYDGLLNIPIVGDFIELFALVTDDNIGADEKGRAIGDWIGTGITTAIGQIPIVGDILRLLGLIPSTEPTANANGKGVGDNVNKGYFSGTTDMISKAVQEFQDIANGIRNKMGEAFSAAQDFAGQMWDGLNSVLQRHSPGFFHDQVLAEFGTDIPNAISSSGSTAYDVARGYATQIKQGIADTGTTTIGMDSMVDDYESDAQTIATSSQMMGVNTTTAFNDMSNAVNSTTNTMTSNVMSSYTSMQSKQSSSLNTMKQQNISAYNDMYLKSNQSLIQMRDSTSNITHQMTDAWTHMKNSIVQSADQLRSESTNHFNTLSNTIGTFYRKIQNPSNWGSAGSPTLRSKGTNRRVGKAFSSSIKHGYAGGNGNRWGGSDTMTISALKHKLFPSGTGYGDMFDGFKATDVVDVSQFLSLMIEKGHGFGGWDYSNSHYNYIKSTSDQWSMKSPTIQLKGGIPTNADYKVADFENGSPKISFSSFQSMAESIFSAIPYRFYYDSDWKGSWLGALEAGACNCWDGAHAILAFANSCGFGGSVEHGTWVDPDGTTYPHVYAVINGKKMDTTGWQQRRSWSAGSPNVGRNNVVKPNSNNNNPPVNITVNINEPVYGIDDLDEKISDSIDKGLQKHFNKSYAIGI